MDEITKEQILSELKAMEMRIKSLKKHLKIEESSVENVQPIFIDDFLDMKAMREKYGSDALLYAKKHGYKGKVYWCPKAGKSIRKWQRSIKRS